MKTWEERERVLTELQGGFRRGWGLEDNVYTLTQCIEVARKEGRCLICCFLDCAKAYDSVPHDLLLKRLKQLDMPPEWTGLFRRLYKDNTVQTAMGEATSDEAMVTRGLRHSCPLSPLLYMLYVARMEERLIRSGLGFSLQHMEEGQNVNWVLPGLTFADNIVLTACSVETMQLLLDICADEAAVLGRQHNTTKSAVVQFAGFEEGRTDSLKIGVGT